MTSSKRESKSVKSEQAQIETVKILAESKIPFPKEARLNSVVAVRESKHIQRRTLLSMAAGFNPKNEIDEALLCRLLRTIKVNVNTECRSNLLHHPFRQGKSELIKYILAHDWMLNLDCECRFVDVMDAFEKYDQLSKEVALKSIREMLNAPASINFSATKNNLTALAKAFSLHENHRADFVKEIFSGIKAEGAHLILSGQMNSEETLEKYARDVTKGAPETFYNKLKLELGDFLSQYVLRRIQSLPVSGEKKQEEKPFSIEKVKTKYDLLELLNNYDFFQSEKKSKNFLREMIKEKNLGFIYILINHVKYEDLLDIFIQVLKEKEDQYQFSIINLLLRPLNENKLIVDLIVKKYLELKSNPNSNLSVVLLRKIRADIRSSQDPLTFILVDGPAWKKAVTEWGKASGYGCHDSDLDKMIAQWYMELKIDAFAHADVKNKHIKLAEELKKEDYRNYADFSIERARRQAFLACKGKADKADVFGSYAMASYALRFISQSDIANYSDLIQCHLESTRFVVNDRYAELSALVFAYGSMVSFDYDASHFRDKNEKDQILERIQKICSQKFNQSEEKQIFELIEDAIKDAKLLSETISTEVIKIYQCVDVLFDAISELSKDKLQERAKYQSIVMEYFCHEKGKDREVDFWFLKLVDSLRASLLKELTDIELWAKSFHLLFKMLSDYSKASADNLSASLEKIYPLIDLAIKEIKSEGAEQLNFFRYSLMRSEIVCLKKQKKNSKRRNFLHDEMKKELEKNLKLKSLNGTSVYLRCALYNVLARVSVDANQDPKQAEKYLKESIVTGLAALDKIPNTVNFVYPRVSEAIIALYDLNPSYNPFEYFDQMYQLIEACVKREYNLDLLESFSSAKIMELDFVLKENSKPFNERAKKILLELFGKNIFLNEKQKKSLIYSCHYFANNKLHHEEFFEAFDYFRQAILYATELDKNALLNENSHSLQVDFVVGVNKFISCTQIVGGKLKCSDLEKKNLLEEVYKLGIMSDKFSKSAHAFRAKAGNEIYMASIFFNEKAFKESEIWYRKAIQTLSKIKPQMLIDKNNIEHCLSAIKQIYQVFLMEEKVRAVSVEELKKSHELEHEVKETKSLAGREVKSVYPEYFKLIHEDSQKIGLNAVFYQSDKSERTLLSGLAGNNLDNVIHKEALFQLLQDENLNVNSDCGSDLYRFAIEQLDMDVIKKLQKHGVIFCASRDCSLIETLESALDDEFFEVEKLPAVLKQVLNSPYKITFKTDEVDDDNGDYYGVLDIVLSIQNEKVRLQCQFEVLNRIKAQLLRHIDTFSDSEELENEIIDILGEQPESKPFLREMKKSHSAWLEMKSDNALMLDPELNERYGLSKFLDQAHVFKVGEAEVKELPLVFAVDHDCYLLQALLCCKEARELELKEGAALRKAISLGSLGDISALLELKYPNIQDYIDFAFNVKNYKNPEFQFAVVVFILNKFDYSFYQKVKINYAENLPKLMDFHLKNKGQKDSVVLLRLIRKIIVKLCPEEFVKYNLFDTSDRASWNERCKKWFFSLVPENNQAHLLEFFLSWSFVGAIFKKNEYQKVKDFSHYPAPDLLRLVQWQIDSSCENYALADKDLDTHMESVGEEFFTVAQMLDQVYRLQNNYLSHSDTSQLLGCAISASQNLLDPFVIARSWLLAFKFQIEMVYVNKASSCWLEVKDLNKSRSKILECLNKKITYHRDKLIKIDQQVEAILVFLLEKNLFEYELLKSLMTIKESVVFKLVQKGLKENEKKARLEAIKQILMKINQLLEKLKKSKNTKLLESIVEVAIDFCFKSYDFDKEFYKKNIKKLVSAIRSCQEGSSDSQFCEAVSRVIVLTDEAYEKLNLRKNKSDKPISLGKAKLTEEAKKSASLVSGKKESDGLVSESKKLFVKPEFDSVLPDYYRQQSMFEELKKRASQYNPSESDREAWKALFGLSYKRDNDVSRSDVNALEDSYKKLEILIKRASKITPVKVESKSQESAKSMSKGKLQYELSLQRKRELEAKQKPKQKKQPKKIESTPVIAAQSVIASEARQSSVESTPKTEQNAGAGLPRFARNDELKRQSLLEERKPESVVVVKEAEKEKLLEQKNEKSNEIVAAQPVMASETRQSSVESTPKTEQNAGAGLPRFARNDELKSESLLEERKSEPVIVVKEAEKEKLLEQKNEKSNEMVAAQPVMASETRQSSVESTPKAEQNAGAGLLRFARNDELKRQSLLEERKPESVIVVKEAEKEKLLEQKNEKSNEMVAAQPVMASETRQSSIESAPWTEQDDLLESEQVATFLTAGSGFSLFAQPLGDALLNKKVISEVKSDEMTFEEILQAAELNLPDAEMPSLEGYKGFGVADIFERKAEEQKNDSDVLKYQFELNENIGKGVKTKIGFFSDWSVVQETEEHVVVQRDPGTFPIALPAYNTNYRKKMSS